MARPGPWVWTRSAPPARAAGVLLRLAGTGHPEIRARHHLTVEFAAASSITARATCVVAVDTTVTAAPASVAGPPPAEAAGHRPAGTAERPPAGTAERPPARAAGHRPAGVAAIAGPVDIVVTAGGERADLAAVANPGWRPGGTAVVRRSANRLPGTLATDADAAAADLPRSLIARLVQPGVPVEVVVRPRARHRDGRAGLVLLALDASAPDATRLATELAVADVVVAEDAGAADLVRAAGVVPGAPPWQTADPWLRDDAVRAVADGHVHRVLVLATAGLPGNAVSPLLARPDLFRVEAGGLPAHLAAAAASPRRAAVYVAGRLEPGDARSVLRQVPPDAQLVFSAAAGQWPALLKAAAVTRHVDTGVVAVRPGLDPWTPWGPVAAVPVSRGAEVVCCLDGVDAVGLDASPDPAVAVLVRRLADEGVATKTLAAALAAALGWPRGRAYDAVTRLRTDALPPA